MSAGINGALAWITRRQEQGPDEVRSARMLAVLLVFMGLYHPIALVLFGWLTPWLPNPAEAAPFTAAFTAVTWGCYVLLRRGHFNMAASLFLVVSLAGVGWPYLRWGLAIQSGAQLLAGGVAHDFNHLLGLVLGYAQRGRQEQDVGQLHAMFEGVESAARRAAGVSRRLLDFSRLEATHPKVFDAAGLVEELRPMMRHMFPDEVELRIALPSTPQQVFFDPDQLELMLLNLASNAAEAMPGGGVFTVSLSGQDPQWVEISAGDTGRGMTPEEVDRCREPFYTTKPAGQGTGLGLAVVSDLAGQAGGELLIDSVPGEGTTVRIRLPRRTPVR